MPASEPQSSAGLAGVVVGDSSICRIDGDAGELFYRGYSIADLALTPLAGASAFEEAAHLLWFGELPGRGELTTLGDELGRARQLPPGVLDQLRALPRGARPMDVLRTLVSMLGAYERPAERGATPVARAMRMTGAIAAGIAAFHRIREQLPVLEPRADLGHGGNFLWMLLGEVPDRAASRAFDIALVLHMEHGFNASTFAGRVAASTLADLHGAVTAAVATLEGPLHGGANERVMKMLLEIGTVEAAPGYVRDRLGRGEKIMGFGHRVYRTEDPRATVLKALARKLSNGRNDQLFAVSEAVARAVGQALAGKGIAANVDFYSATVYDALGIPRDIFTPIFAVARIVGWTAHALEQYENNRLIRPKSRYVGHERRTFVPIDERP